MVFQRFAAFRHGEFPFPDPFPFDSRADTKCPEQKPWVFRVVRDTRIELVSNAWEAFILPLN